MNRVGKYAMAVVAAGGSCTLAYFLYSYVHHYIVHKEVMATIIPMDELNSVPADRKVRFIMRTPEMAQAFSQVSQFFQDAQKLIAERNYNLEVRGYASDQNVDLTGERIEFGPNPFACDSLQLFRINSDLTVSPLGEKLSLPPHIVFYPNECALGIDVKKRICSIYMYSGGNIIFFKTDAYYQAPIADRMLTFLYGHVYQDGGADIEARVYWQHQIPGMDYRDSEPVRPDY